MMKVTQKLFDHRLVTNFGLATCRSRKIDVETRAMTRGSEGRC